MLTMAQALALVDKLGKALDDRAKEVAAFEAWYDGDHPVPQPPPNTFPAVDVEARQAFTGMARMGITNFMPPIVDQAAQKLRIEDIRFGEGDRSTDEAAWRIYQSNRMDRSSSDLDTAAIKVGNSNVLVWGDSDDRAVVTAEDPATSIVAYEAGHRRRRKAALKRWVDEDGFSYATLYEPDAVWKFRSQHKATATSTTAGGSLVLPSSYSGQRPTWVPREDEDDTWPLVNPLGKVSMVELAVDAGLKWRPYGGGRSVLAAAITDQRRINQTTLDRLVTQEWQSFRQRWVTGWRPPVDPKTGEVDRYALLEAGASNIAVFGDKDAKVGEFAQADFRMLIELVWSDVKAICVRTSTPPYAMALGSDMVNVAADALARIEGSHAARVRNLGSDLDEGHEDWVRLALEVEKNALAADPTLRIVRAELETPSPKEQAEVATMAKDLGLPPEVYLAYMPGVDQQEARRLAQQAVGAKEMAEAVAEVPAQ